MVRRKSKGIFCNIQAGKGRISLGIVCNEKRSLEKKKLRRRDEVCAQRRREKREGKKEREVVVRVWFWEEGEFWKIVVPKERCSFRSRNWSYFGLAAL